MVGVKAKEPPKNINSLKLSTLLFPLQNSNLGRCDGDASCAAIDPGT